MSKRIHILGSNIDVLTMKETIEKVKELIESKSCVQHVVVNAGKINLMNSDSKLKKIVNDCQLINADGQSVVWAAKLLKNPLPERVTGIDLFEKLVALSATEGYKLYFFGATQQVIEEVVKIYKEQYPSINIAGYRNGYFKEEESKFIAEEINKSGADILFVAFSSPKKEYWIHEFMPIMKVPFAMGVGGSFDIIAKVTKRAPVFMQKLGLEWFYRLVQEPGRMWKRYLVGNTKFIKLVLKEKFSGKKFK